MMSSITKYSNSFMTVVMLVIFTGAGHHRKPLSGGGALHAFRARLPGHRTLPAAVVSRCARSPRHNECQVLVFPQRGSEKAEEQVSRSVGHQVHFDVGDIRLPDQGLEPGEHCAARRWSGPISSALILGIILFGFHLAVPIFLVVFLRYRAEASWRLTLGLSSAGVCICLYIMFEHVLHMRCIRASSPNGSRTLIGSAKCLIAGRVLPH